MRYPLRFCLLILCSIQAAFAAASSVQNDNDEAALQQRLARIQKQIAQVRQALNTARGEEKKLLDELQRQDQLINAQHQKIRQQQQLLQDSEARIQTVKQRIDKQNRLIHSQKQELATLLKLALYTRHDLGLKRLLLASGSRRNDLAGHQIRYLQQRLYALIETIASQIRQLEALHAEFTAEQKQLETNQQRLLAQQEQLQQQRQQRRFVLQAVRDKMRADQKELRQLDKNRQRLNQLLTELQNLLDDLPDDLGRNARFARLKGTLPKPVNGRLIHRFGSTRSRERQRWEGLVFNAKAGQPIQAVAYGRVAFADWLRGYGLLVVLDHGDGYMTLYGHNEALLVEPGDWVQPGQDIALAGNSGSLAEPALYFELRHDARPINPAPWLKSR